MVLLLYNLSVITCQSRELIDELPVKGEVSTLSYRLFERLQGSFHHHSRTFL
jgi:hypothetical protein